MRPNLVWFRDDLRVADNPALHAAWAGGAPLICLYIIDETPPLRPSGGAVRWWLRHSLTRLSETLEKLGATLVLCRGDAAEIMRDVAMTGAIGSVFWNDRYVPEEAAKDMAIARLLAGHNIPVHRFNGNYLNPPEAILNSSGGPFKVFTPYWHAVLRRGIFTLPLDPPQRINGARWPSCAAPVISIPELAPKPLPWMERLATNWRPGERSARQALEIFLGKKLQGYAGKRDAPAYDATSRLSPHLRFGEISPLQIWHAVEIARQTGEFSSQDTDKFINELIWREYACHVLHHFPSLSVDSRIRNFDRISWLNEPAQIRAWQEGRTGFPLVDAGMRQLWQTGWMHNRVRMIVGSFLVKHLLCDWRIGENWFWNTLVDADQANNVFGWQWIAGCGFDASPFHRIFNPILQSERFDPKGAYIRKYVPELAHLPNQLIHTPWKVPTDLSGKFKAVSYPEPIVDLAAARQRALNALNAAKDETNY